MKLLLIIRSILLFTSPLSALSKTKHESVSQCVLRTMTEKKLSEENEMFEVFKEECEIILGKVDTGVQKNTDAILSL